MSILITGVDMPTGCAAITLQVWRNGEVEIYAEEEWKTSKAVPVPQHGRLIDADELRNDWLENGENAYIYDTNSFLWSLDAAPTIIPAE